jgi:hypothetical protein
MKYDPKHASTGMIRKLYQPKKWGAKAFHELQRYEQTELPSLPICSCTTLRAEKKNNLKFSTIHFFKTLAFFAD